MAFDGVKLFENSCEYLERREGKLLFVEERAAQADTERVDQLLRLFSANIGKDEMIVQVLPLRRQS